MSAKVCGNELDRELLGGKDHVVIFYIQCLCFARNGKCIHLNWAVLGCGS